MTGTVIPAWLWAKSATTPVTDMEPVLGVTLRLGSGYTTSTSRYWLGMPEQLIVIWMVVDVTTGAVGQATVHFPEYDVPMPNAAAADDAGWLAACVVAGAGWVDVIWGGGTGAGASEEGGTAGASTADVVVEVEAGVGAEQPDISTIAPIARTSGTRMNFSIVFPFQNSAGSPQPTTAKRYHNVREN